MQEYLPIGSIVEFSDHKAMIAGYYSEEINGKASIDYIIIPWPMGIIDQDSIIQIAADRVSVLHEGYRSDSSEDFRNLINAVAAASDQYSSAEIIEILQSAGKAEKEID